MSEAQPPYQPDLIYRLIERPLLAVWTVCWVLLPFLNIADGGVDWWKWPIIAICWGIQGVLLVCLWRYARRRACNHQRTRRPRRVNR